MPSAYDRSSETKALGPAGSKATAQTFESICSSPVD